MTGNTERLVALREGAGAAEWMALSRAAHWNQNEADWQMMLALGRGWGLRVRDAQGVETLAASTLVLPYEGRFAWISMVLVLPAWRGQGLAGRLLQVALQHLRSEQLLPVLDATPAGRPVYLKHGFVDAWGFERWRRPAAPARPVAAAAAAPACVRPLRATDWPAIEALDAPAFGASRQALLQRLWQRAPALGWVLPDGRGALRGFLLGREGRTALQFGPLVLREADEPHAAAALVGAALHALSQRAPEGAPLPALIVDLRLGQGGFQAWLQRQGFRAERPFTRMLHAAMPGARAPGEAAHIALVAGPELG